MTTTTTMPTTTTPPAICMVHSLAVFEDLLLLSEIGQIATKVRRWLQ